MILFHVVWWQGRLFLWGEQLPSARGEPGEGDSLQPVSSSALRAAAGDVWDSLLIADAAETSIRLWLPGVPGRIRPSFNPIATPDGRSQSPNNELAPVDLPALEFAPADAADLLTGWPRYEKAGVRRADSFLYWSRVAELVLELLARQRLVPAVHRRRDGSLRGFWRVVIDDDVTSDRLRRLILAMPPVCRAMALGERPIQAAELVEQFLWISVDSLVRRCLEQDELAHALLDRPLSECTADLRWLRSLVQTDPLIEAAPDHLERIHGSVGAWLGSLAPTTTDRAFRTCMRLHAPDAAQLMEPDARAWRLTLHVQATDDPTLVVDADRLADEPALDPAILRRPFDRALEQLRLDLARAARHVPQLSACAEPGGPLDAWLTTEEAYRFLRDATPLLETEGFSILVPRWWRDTGPRLRMQLNLTPGSNETGEMRLDSIVHYNWRVAVGEQELTEDELLQLAAAKQPLVQLRGRWTEIQRSDVQTALRFLDQNRPGDMTVMQALHAYYSADDSDTGIPVAGLAGDGWIERFLNTPHVDERVDPLQPPDGFVGVLRPYQLRGLAWLSFLSRYRLGACLADDMGLGKTIQLIALLLHERQEGEPVGPTLLVVPMSVVGNWQRELERFAPTLRVLVHHGVDRLTGQVFVDTASNVDVVVSTYGLVHRDREQLSQVGWHRLTLDEAQNIKNSAAKQATAVRQLPANHRIALTGTPVENRLSELWSILDFLNPGYLGQAAEFRRRFAVPVERHRDVNRADRLRHLIRPFVLRRLKEDPAVAIDLPEKMESDVLCNLTREQASLYQAVVDDMLGQIDRSAGIQRRGLILATLVKLKQICNHPAQFLRDGNPAGERSGKYDRLQSMLEEVVAEDHRALVFTQFREMGELLQDLLQRALDRRVLFLHGGVPQRQRDELINQFQSGSAETPVFLLSLRAGGFGLNLTAANHVFHYDRWWNPAVEDQATDRAHRIGQERTVLVHKFLCVGTLEERIAAMIDQKRSLAEKVVGSGEDWLTELSTEALRDLLHLSRDAVADE